MQIQRNKTYHALYMVELRSMQGCTTEHLQSRNLPVQWKSFSTWQGHNVYYNCFLYRKLLNSFRCNSTCTVFTVQQPSTKVSPTDVAINGQVHGQKAVKISDIINCKNEDLLSGNLHSIALLTPSF